MILDQISKTRPKDPFDIWPVTFDFVRLVPVFDSAVWSIAVASGVDPGVASMLFGAAVSDGARTTQLIRNGVSGAVYLLRADITAGPAKYSLAAYLSVRQLGS